jgi:hypothetical protein
MYRTVPSCNRFPHGGSLAIIQCGVGSPLAWSDIFTISPNMGYIYSQVVPFETIQSQEAYTGAAMLTG